MPDRADELIAEITARRGIAVSRDDPIMVLQTINNRLLQNSASARQTPLDQFKQEMEALTLRWENDAQGKAERILNAALAAGKDAMWQTMQDGAGAASISMRAEIDAGLGHARALFDSTRRIALICMAASLLAASRCWLLAAGCGDHPKGDRGMNRVREGHRAFSQYGLRRTAAYSR